MRLQDHGGFTQENAKPVTVNSSANYEIIPLRFLEKYRCWCIFENMVKLRDLNRICRERVIAAHVPAQVTCRLLGNSQVPCPIDKLCQETDKRGILLYLSLLFATSLLAFGTVFWALRITYVGRVLGFLGNILLPPLKWLGQAFGLLYQGYQFLVSLFDE